MRNSEMTSQVTSDLANAEEMASLRLSTASPPMVILREPSPLRSLEETRAVNASQSLPVTIDLKAAGRLASGERLVDPGSPPASLISSSSSSCSISVDSLSAGRKVLQTIRVETAYPER